MTGTALPTGSAADAVDTRAVHAAIAPVDALLDERRTLYRLAVELLLPDTPVSDTALDSPLVRYRIGKALAGHGSLEESALDDTCQTTLVSGVRVVTDPLADTLLADALRIIAPAGAQLRLLSSPALSIVDEGVQLARSLDQSLVDDLLAHVSLLAILDGTTAHGLVSASSRYVPGLVVIDEPSSPMQVAEALVHEGAHTKFFDLAITRSFLDVRAESVEYFETSWSHARWPLEQTFAAWHAYRMLAEFALSCSSFEPGSLLPVARERAAEIGNFLRAHASYLGEDALRLLGGLSGPALESGVRSPWGARELNTAGHFHVVPGARMRRAALTGRVVVARERAGMPPDMFWLDQDSSLVLEHLNRNEGRVKAAADMLVDLTGIWEVDSAAAQRRLAIALDALVGTMIVRRDDHVPLDRREG